MVHHDISQKTFFANPMTSNQIFRQKYPTNMILTLLLIVFSVAPALRASKHPKPPSFAGALPTNLDGLLTRTGLRGPSFEGALPTGTELDDLLTRKGLRGPSFKGALPKDFMEGPSFKGALPKGKAKQEQQAIRDEFIESMYGLCLI